MGAIVFIIIFLILLGIGGLIAEIIDKYCK